MSLEHVIALVDILTTVEKLEEAVEVVRKGQRWLQGRVEQKYWDTFEDDREYAPEGEEGHELDIGLRHRLALLRLRLGNDEEAFVSYLSTTERNLELTKRAILGRSSSLTLWPTRICLWNWEKH